MDAELILELMGVSVRYPGAERDALHDVSLAVRAGEFHALLGPNGSGKTTLVRAALGLVPFHSGAIRLAGSPPARWSRRELARVVGVMPQREDNLFPQRVRDTVLLGRYPHLSVWGRARDADRNAVELALDRCDVRSLEHRWIWTLSGGEYQRVRLARALAQEPRLLVLDEPTASLDVRHEMQLFQLARELAAPTHGLAVLLITHHVNLAARFADRLLLLDNGRPAAGGAPADVLRRDIVEAVFGWPVAIERFDDRPQMIPLRTGKDSA